jgi:hypothetical protein
MRIRAAAAALFLAQAAAAQTPPEPAKIRDILQRVGMPAADATLVDIPIVHGRELDDDELAPEDQRTNFAYGDIDARLEKTVIGRGKKKRKVKSGVTPADRVENGKIKYIVVHSSLGTYNGTIGHLDSKPQAVHFVVGLNGDVTRMVELKDIGLHVKNDEINAVSVGIETESFTRSPKPYRTKKGKLVIPPLDWKSNDWDPDITWRMYSSLAWLIRAISKECGVPRDLEHVIGHREADLLERDGHTDPGPFFYDKVYPAFEARFPGEGVTPRAYLMRLINDDEPPKIHVGQTPAGSVIAARDGSRTGVAKLVLYKLQGIVATPVQTWTAPEHGLPPSSASLPMPPAAGDYRAEAFDLVGNVTRARFTVPEPASVTNNLPAGNSSGPRITVE